MEGTRTRSICPGTSAHLFKSIPKSTLILAMNSTRGPDFHSNTTGDESTPHGGGALVAVAVVGGAACACSGVDVLRSSTVSKVMSRIEFRIVVCRNVVRYLFFTRPSSPVFTSLNGHTVKI